ncbi:hypothetical protein EYF80_004878 [Liparis tanakae]|uniref:Uncharacterized protein n=1 Tax=Liparis tanakae TaxID=230148 RepID=A0A4Z2J5N0_9TELE|nr:hypothetical protein EYF80_004878 [Liparis tanakae]
MADQDTGDPVELLREGVVERRYAVGVDLPQQHVAVPVHLPQHAGQSVRQPVGVVHVGQRRRHGKRRSRWRRFARRKLVLARNDLQEAVAQVPESWHRGGTPTLAAVVVAGDGFKFHMGTPLSLRGAQDVQPLLGELSAPRRPSGAEAHVKQHHSQHQAEPPEDRHQGNVHGLHVSVGLELRSRSPRGGGRGQGPLGEAAGGDGRAGSCRGVRHNDGLHGEVRVRVHPDGVKINQDCDGVLQGEAAVRPTLLGASADDEEAVRADAVARIEVVSLELFAVQRPAWSCQVGAQFTLEQHVVARHHRAPPVDH